MFSQIGLAIPASTVGFFSRLIVIGVLGTTPHILTASLVKTKVNDVLEVSAGEGENWTDVWGIKLLCVLLGLYVPVPIQFVHFQVPVLLFVIVPSSVTEPVWQKMVDNEEADLLSNHLKQTREIFEEKYVEKGSNGLMIMNQMPCQFLSENKCTVYEQRFAGCKEFPAMHLPNFKKRLFTTFMHYNRCPIIFNVIEQLKVALKSA